MYFYFDLLLINKLKEEKNNNNNENIMKIDKECNSSS